MNLPVYSLENKKIIYFFLAVMLIGGIYSFFKLPKKEDSPFVIKQAVLVTQYPGATPLEVEKLITEPIEREIQSMSDVFQIKSESYFGMSKISIELQPTLAPDYMPVKWDELRRKVANIQPRLPSGASAINVSDDFGDVFGIYYALTADEGFTYDDMRDWAQKIKTELTPIRGVQKVYLFAEQTQVVNVRISVPKLANLGIDPNSIQQVLQTQNLLVNTGEILTGTYQLRVRAEGTYKSIEDIRDQLIVTKGGGEVRLGDIATIERGYMDPPSNLMRVDGKRAIGIGVATGAKDDVVAVGNAVAEHLKEMEQLFPIGMDLKTIYPENKIANEANNGFILNLIESLLIVIVIIFLVMGSRAGMLVGSSLLFSVGGTLLIMLIWGVGLNRTSLAAFIIAMGMLVDNAIVVTDNAQVGIKRGLSRYQALIDGATKPQWALLGATFIAVCSFLPMYLAPASVAEIVKPLFIVLAVSLGLSWILALTQTTTFGNFILKEAKPGESKDPYDTQLYHKFEKVLGRLIKRRYLTLASVVATLFLSLFIMSIMPQSFFPIMNKPYFRADLIFPEGYGIDDVERNVIKIEEYLKNNDKIKSYSFTLGGSPVRYYLASSSIGPKPNFANVLIETKDAKDAQSEENKFYEYMVANYPDILTRSALFALSPVPDAAIEIGFVGDNIDTLVALTQRAQEIARKNDMVMEVRNSWGNKVPVWKPLYSQEKGLRLGITRQQMAYSLRSATNGLPLGEYREGDVFMPILLKDADRDSMNLNDIKTLPVYSAKGRSVKVEQVIDDFSLDYEYSVVKRYNRQRYMMMQCEPKRGANTMAAFSQLWQEVQQEVQVPEGYKLQYFGEQSEQDKGNKAIAANIPLMFGLIYLTLLFLFPKYYRKPVLIMCMLPLIFIGVVLGLLVFGKSLDFFAMLGLLGLIGMNIKNAIVLVDEIGLQLGSGLSPVNAVIEATKTRIVPVTMASGTTILGMLPLLGDAMFAGMAATIMGGLFVSTILTIFVLPVTYCIFFKIKSV
ncbi:efflux RND transporter permease subunit [Parabacteroides massiliensis]|uniref:efflux RND transporter permease subunit n=1 Tax=Parabacteroides massiliensis TaxID=1750560 RepID=UPI00096A7A88|nr:efflux RND transporter permease subunit [Parabacteroides massiliensis]